MVRTLVAAIGSVALAAATLTTSPAASSQPTEVHKDPFVFDQYDTTSCDFPFREQADGFITRTVFFDDSGAPTRIRVHANLDGTATNEANGKSSQFQENLVIVNDLATGQRVWSGMRLKATWPGGGAVLMDVGRVIFDDGEVVFEAGQHQLVHDDFETFCAALS